MNGRWKNPISALLWVMLFLVLAQPARAAVWNHTQIDNAADVGKSLSMAVDPDGKLYIGYLDDNSPDFLKYANNAGGSWAIENLANTLPYAMNTSTATVFTPGGPRIMAYTYNSALGKYMYRAARKVTGDGWQLQDIAGGISPLDGSVQPAMGTVSTSTQTGSTQFMGFTYITYNDGAKLWYANERDMAWYQISNAGSSDSQGGVQSDLAIDANGNVHVVYVDAKNNLYYAKNPTAPGQAVKIQDNNSSISTPSIAIDSNNVIHVVYALKATNGKVYYKSSSNGGASWSTSVSIGESDKYGGYTTIKVDSADNLHVAWYRSDTDDLRYNMKRAADGWVYSTTYGEAITYAGSSSNYGQYAAMAIDRYNNVHIAYYNIANSSLDLVTKPNPAIDVAPSPLLFGYVPQYDTSEPQSVTIANRGNADLTITGIGAPSEGDFEVVANGCTPLPRTLAAGASCTVSYQFDPDVPGAQSASVSIVSNDPTAASRTLTLKGTATATANHTIMAGTTGPGGTISPAGMVSVADGVSQTFTITPDPGYLVAMVAVDPAGMTQQDMMAASKGALTSYTFDEVAADHSIYVMFMPYVAVSTWSTTEIDNEAYTGRNCSIAFDPDNNLHIGYLQSASSTFTTPLLKYASNAGGSWSASSLITILPNAMNASTATVYTPGGPRVMAYSYDSATQEYKYQAARKILGDGWQLQDVGGGISPLDGSPQPEMTAVSSATQTGALQHKGFTFITFNNGNYLQYANERDMAWYKITDAGSAAGNGGTQSDLALDSAGNVHVLYVDALNNLMYAANPRTPGAAATIQDSTGVISNPNVAIDASDTLHAVYLDGADKIVKYIKKPAGGAWSSPMIIGPAGAYGGYVGIKADNTGGIHIAYYYSTSTSTGLLMYQHILPSGGRGSQEVVRDPNNSANYGQYAAMAIDNNNIVNIAYYDVSRSSLKVTRLQTFGIDAAPSPTYFGNVSQGSSTTETVTVSNRGTFGNLVIRGSASIGGADAADFAIDSSTCSDGLTIAPGAPGCQVMVRFSPSSAGARTATLVIGSNDLLIPYKSVPLSGTSNPPASYTINAGVMGVGGTISPAGAVAVTGSGSQTFTITPDPGYLVAMVAVDPQGMTQEAMMAASQGALLSYTFDQVTADHGIYVMFMQAIPVTSWEITQVDNSGTTGKYCSITNDPDGKLHVGYIEGTTTLKYATNRDGLWAFETVSAIPDVTSAGTATVFSEGVGPRVMAYSYNATTGARKYGAARKWTEVAPPGGSLNDWQLQWVAGDYYPPEYGGGAQPPIYSTTSDTFTGATQSDGYTFITYTDGNNLWYANEKDFYYLKLDPTHSVAGAGKQSDLVLDADKNIHIIYYTPGVNGTGELRYGFGQGGYTDPVNNPPEYGESVLLTGITSDPSITMDGNSELHVSYIQSGRVKYLNGSLVNGVRVWSAPLDIGPCGTNGAYTSIKANGLNIVHLTYYAYNSANAKGQLMYVTRSPEGQWSAPQAVPDTPANVGQYAALAVDMNHNVNIAYYDVSNSALKVAKRLIPVITAPAAVNFGTVAPDVAAEQIITVSNLGQANLRLGTVTLDGPDAARFQVTDNTCSGQSVAPGASCYLTVRFMDAVTGSNSATLHITSDDRYAPHTQIALTATVSGGQLYTITATTENLGGSITPNGAFSIASGGSQRFDFTPSPGFFIADVKVDGVSNEAAKQAGYHEFVDVTADHSISVSFASNVRIGEMYYGSIQAAYNGTASGQTIMIRGEPGIFYNEDLLFNLMKIIVFAGGFDSTFSLQNGATVVYGDVGISSGGIEVQNLGLE